MEAMRTTVSDIETRLNILVKAAQKANQEIDEIDENANREIKAIEQNVSRLEGELEVSFAALDEVGEEANNDLDDLILTQAKDMGNLYE